MNMKLNPLDTKVEVYVPSTVNVDESHKGRQDKWTDEALTRLADIFGGASCIPGIGAWVSKTKGLVKEPINIVYAYTTEKTLEEKRVSVLKLAIDICREMKQEAVTVIFNGKMYFVSLTDNELSEAA